MRGTAYAVIEVLVFLIGALLIGYILGWYGWFAGRRRAESKLTARIKDLEAKAGALEGRVARPGMAKQASAAAVRAPAPKRAAPETRSRLDKSVEKPAKRAMPKPPEAPKPATAKSVAEPAAKSAATQAAKQAPVPPTPGGSAKTAQVPAGQARASAPQAADPRKSAARAEPAKVPAQAAKATAATKPPSAKPQPMPEKKLESKPAPAQKSEMATPKPPAPPKPAASPQPEKLAPTGKESGESEIDELMKRLNDRLHSLDDKLSEMEEA